MKPAHLPLRRPVSLIVWLILLGLSIAAFAASYAVDPWKNRISFSDSFHVSLRVLGDLNPRVIFYNNAKEGPLQDKLFNWSPLNYPKSIEFGWIGFDFRHHRWPDHVVWSVAVSLWYPIILSALCAAVSFWRWKARCAKAQAVSASDEGKPVSGTTDAGKNP